MLQNPVENRFLLVDDHTLIRSALRSVLLDLYPNAVIDESVDGNDIVEKLKTTSFSLIIMDIQMPNGETLRHITHINVNYPAIPVLIYSMSAENVYASRVLKAGAKGFVSKMSPLDELCKAIGLAMNGKTYLSMVTAEQLSSQISLKSDSPFVQLSPRELEVVVYLLEGKTGTQISNELHLQKSTIGTHKSKIFQKLKVKNLLELKEMSDIHQL